MSWIIFLIITTICWGSYNLFYETLEGHINPFLAITLIGLTEAVICIPFLIHQYYSSENILFSTKTIFITVIMGVLISVGTVSFLHAFKIGAITSIAVPSFAIGAMIIGAIGGLLFFHEHLTIKTISGLFLGVLAIILITGGGK